jgi:hypothetical protein
MNEETAYEQGERIIKSYASNFTKKAFKLKIEEEFLGGFITNEERKKLLTLLKERVLINGL